MDRWIRTPWVDVGEWWRATTEPYPSIVLAKPFKPPARIFVDVPISTLSVNLETVRLDGRKLVSAAPMNRFKDRYQCIVFGSDAHVNQALTRLNQIGPMLRLIEMALG